MKNLTLSLGILLIILGLASYFGTGRESVTALIPAFFGLVFTGLGALAGIEKIKKHVMHVAVALAVLSLFGAARGIPGVIEILGGGVVERPVAVYAQAAMFTMCLVYVVASVRSFIATRRAAAEE